MNQHRLRVLVQRAASSWAVWAPCLPLRPRGWPVLLVHHRQQLGQIREERRFPAQHFLPASKIAWTISEATTTVEERRWTARASSTVSALMTTSAGQSDCAQLTGTVTSAVGRGARRGSHQRQQSCNIHLAKRASDTGHQVTCSLRHAHEPRPKDEADEKVKDRPAHIREFIVVQLREQADRACLLRVMDRDRVHRCHRK